MRKYHSTLGLPLKPLSNRQRDLLMLILKWKAEFSVHLKPRIRLEGVEGMSVDGKIEKLTESRT